MNGAGTWSRPQPAARDRPVLIIEARPGAGWLDRYGRAVVVAMLALIYLDLPVFLYQVDDRLLPKYFYAGGAAMLLPVLVRRWKFVREHIVSPFGLWIAACICVYFGHLLVATAAADAERVRQILVGMQYLGLLAIYSAAVWSTPRSQFQWIFPLVLPFALVGVVTDFLWPGTLYSLEDGGTLGRAAGTYINPNKAAEALILLMLFSLPVVPRWLRLPLVLCTGIGVALTLSRAGILCWFVLWMGLAAFRVLPRASILGVALLLAAAPALMNPVLDYFASREDLADGVANIHDRLGFFGSQDLSDGSSVERRLVLENGVELFLANPFFGAGAGVTEAGDGRPEYPHLVGTHNTPVMLLAEFGLVGFASWCTLLWLVWRGRFFSDRPLQIAALGTMMFLALFTHNMLYDALYWLLAIGMFAMRQPAGMEGSVADGRFMA